MERIVIETKELVKTYDETKIPVKALRGVDLLIREGEFTAIVGPSGSGKSTLLNLIGGLDEPTSGQVWVDGVEITNLNAAQRIAFRRQHIGFVFQYFNLVPVLSARENIELVMLLQGKNKMARRKRSQELLNAVGLEDRGSNRPGELSGGQQQRVAVARALASKPAFILADEPTANLDSVSTAHLLDMMARLNKEEQMTFVFSTHDQRVIDRARRIVTLDDGKIVEDRHVDQ